MSYTSGDRYPECQYCSKRNHTPMGCFDYDAITCPHANKYTWTSNNSTSVPPEWVRKKWEGNGTSLR